VNDDLPPVGWGVLGAANIAVAKVIPAMARCARSRVVAIASRDESKATAAARRLGIPRAYGSYEALLADPEVDVVYNPLPNHLHVPWSIRAAEAGKHVLCEKPIALSAAEADTLRAARDRTGVLIGEAFMVRTHPQWLEAERLVATGAIGDLRLVSGHFSYSRRDPRDIRSRAEYGGGALMDIGCYPVTLSRWLFGEEPLEVIAQIERDPELGVDRLTSALLRFPGGQATFACSGQLVPFQRMELFGTRGRIEIEIPFNAPPDRPCRILVDDRSALAGQSARVVEFPIVDQYTLQADRFSDAIRGRSTIPVSVDDGVANMAVIDALFRSADSGRWEAPMTGDGRRAAVTANGARPRADFFPPGTAHAGVDDPTAAVRRRSPA
jgi:predicted dehydrogenase